MDAPALMRMAEQELEEGERDNAIRTLDRLLLAYGDWEGVPRARLLLGDAYYGEEDFLTAAAEYRRFLDRYPGHPLAGQAALGRCRSLAALSPRPERDQTYTEQALTECSNVAVDFQGLQEAAEAREVAQRMREILAEKAYLTGRFYLRRDLWDSAINYFQIVLDRYPGTAAAPNSLLGIYRANRAIGYDDLAETAREQLLARYPDSPAAKELDPGATRG